MRYFAPISLIFLLSACSSSLDTLKEKNPAATDFPGALAAEYRAFAESEAEQGRSRVAEHFAAKGLRALSGVAVGPDALDESLPKATRDDLAAARSQLVKLSIDAVKDAAPQELARAQLVFDCWQQQAVSGIAPEKALCAPEFAPSIDQLLEKAGPEVYGKALRRSIEFVPESTKLTDANLADINDVVCQLSELGADEFRVELRAYVGRKLSQQKLTNARLRNVKNALVKAGVPKRRIRTHREGAKGVMLSRDNIPMNTKVVTITIAAEPNAREAK
ncbi:MAG: hypothetical protein K2Q01_01700 [Rickettsiales bacterium]|nr:hypothetical protein [Rickettsiales bacterium]